MQESDGTGIGSNGLVFGDERGRRRGEVCGSLGLELRERCMQDSKRSLQVRRGARDQARQTRSDRGLGERRLTEGLCVDESSAR